MQNVEVIMHSSCPIAYDLRFPKRFHNERADLLMRWILLQKYTMDICKQMWASAEMVMMSTKCYICSHHHHHTMSGKDNAVNHFLHIDYLLKAFGIGV